MSAPRPWKAIPADPTNEHRQWSVICPSTAGDKYRWHEVATWLDKRDARVISAAHEALELIELLHREALGIIPTIDREAARSMCARVIEKGRGEVKT